MSHHQRFDFLAQSLIARTSLGEEPPSLIGFPLQCFIQNLPCSLPSLGSHKTTPMIRRLDANRVLAEETLTGRNVIREPFVIVSQ
jgi:hypothetical protein